MTASELMKTRYKVISNYPNSVFNVGEIVKTVVWPEEYIKQFPNIFKPLKWFEDRDIDDMPNRLICRAIKGDKEVMDIEEWDMDLMIGWTDKNKRECCSLLTFNYEYGYFPVD